MGGLGLLDKPGVLGNHTDRARGMAFFPGETCKLLFVRGTISFYNQKLQLLPVGERAMWNISMHLNE